MISAKCIASLPRAVQRDFQKFVDNDSSMKFNENIAMGAQLGQKGQCSDATENARRFHGRESSTDLAIAAWTLRKFTRR